MAAEVYLYVQMAMKYYEMQLMIINLGWITVISGNLCDSVLDFVCDLVAKDDVFGKNWSRFPQYSTTKLAQVTWFTTVSGVFSLYI